MADFKSLNNYTVKDEQARNDITNLRIDVDTLKDSDIPRIDGELLLNTTEINNLKLHHKEDYALDSSEITLDGITYDSSTQEYTVNKNNPFPIKFTFDPKGYKYLKFKYLGTVVDSSTARLNGVVYKIPINNNWVVTQDILGLGSAFNLSNITYIHYINLIRFYYRENVGLEIISRSLTSTANDSGTQRLLTWNEEDTCRDNILHKFYGFTLCDE